MILKALGTQRLTKNAIHQAIKNKIGFEISVEYFDCIMDELWFEGKIKSIEEKVSDRQKRRQVDLV